MDGQVADWVAVKAQMPNATVCDSPGSFCLVRVPDDLCSPATAVCEILNYTS